MSAYIRITKSAPELFRTQQARYCKSQDWVEFEQWYTIYFCQNIFYQEKWTLLSLAILPNPFIFASQTCELFLVTRFKKACKQVKEILISYPLMCAMEALKVWAHMRWWEMNYSRLVRVGLLSSSLPYALLEGADFHVCCIERVLQALSKHPIIQWVNMIVMRSMMPI